MNAISASRREFRFAVRGLRENPFQHLFAVHRHIARRFDADTHTAAAGDFHERDYDVVANDDFFTMFSRKD